MWNVDTGVCLNIPEQQRKVAPTYPFANLTVGIEKGVSGVMVDRIDQGVRRRRLMLPSSVHIAAALAYVFNLPRRRCQSS